MTAPDRAKDVETARSLLAGFTANDNEHEALAKYRQYRTLVVRSELKLGELTTLDKNGQPISLQDLMALGDKVKSVAADPDVKSFLGSLVELAKSGGEVVKKVRGRR